MKTINRIYKTITRFLTRLREDQVSAFAAQASFFLMLSLFPLIILLLSAIKYTPVTKGLLLSVSVELFPDALSPLLVSIIEEMYTMSSGTIISITAIAALWSASKGILSLIRGLNYIYHIEEKRNYFHLRLISSIYTFVFVIGLSLSLLLLVFGNNIVKLLEEYSPTLYAICYTLLSFKLLHMPFILTLFFIIIYKLIPLKRYKMVNLLPGALFSALGWMLFSFFYSIYVNNYANNSYMYGSLTTVIFLMLWLYIGIYIFFIGAEINLFFMNFFDNLLVKAKNKLKKSTE